MTDLAAAWTHRITLAEAFDQALELMARALRQASIEELTDFLGGFAPARASGPEWSASLERLIEQMWECLPSATLAQLEATFRARGPVWVGVANSLSAEHGDRLHARRWHPGSARRPAVVLR